MTLGAIAAALILGLITNEFSDVSPWLGRKFVELSARLRYGGNPRADIRAEELAAVINDRPGKLVKLATGIGFLVDALLARAREVIAPRPAVDDPLAEGGLSTSRRIQLAEDEPSPVVERYLFPSERFRGEWRRHWIHPAKAVLMLMLIAALASIAAQRQLHPRYVAPVVAGVAAGTVVLAGFRVLSWYQARFVVTNKRLMSNEGLLFRRVAMIPLVRVTDLRYVQSPLGRLLNYGTFKLESASRRNRLRRIVNLPNPNELYLRIVEEMYEPDAVEARLLSPDGRSPDERADPAAVRQEILLKIGALSAQLATLAAAIERLSPPEAPGTRALASRSAQE